MQGGAEASQCFGQLHSVQLGLALSLCSVVLICKGPREGHLAHLGLALCLLGPVRRRFEVILDDLLQGLHIDLQSHGFQSADVSCRWLVNLCGGSTT